jgi:5-bromo-4-chloroindolyl phosphate hydrolysis protein
VYMSENLGNLEETTKPVLVKEPWKKKEIKTKLDNMILIIYVLNLCCENNIKTLLDQDAVQRQT